MPLFSDSGGTNVLLPHNASCPSLATVESSATQYTTTSSGTIHGPGSLTGKALKALGKATLRGVDQMIIRRRLMNFSTHFPHTDLNASRIKGIEGMYDDLLELSRPGLYSYEIRARALRILIAQITGCQTKALIDAFCRWDSIEIQLFISEILCQLPPIWIPPKAQLTGTSINVSLPSELWPLVLFISQVIRINNTTCRAILDSGYLDKLCTMCENGFKAFFASSITILPHLRSSLHTACNITLLDIVAYPEYRDVVLNHPICSLWPARSRTTKIPAPMGYSTFFLKDYEHLYMSDQSPYFELSLPEVCQMKCVSTMDSGELLSTLASHVTHKQAFRVYLDQATRETKFNVFRGMIDYLTRATETDRQYVHLFYTLSRYSELLYFLMLCAERVRSDISYAIILFDAGINVFLIHIFAAEIRFQFPFQTVTTDDLALLSLDNGTLLDDIRRYGLKRLLSKTAFDNSYALQLVCDVFHALPWTQSPTALSTSRTPVAS